MREVALTDDGGLEAQRPDRLDGEPDSGEGESGDTHSGGAAHADAWPASPVVAHPASPFLPLDDARSPDPRVCPFFRRLDVDGTLAQPHEGPHPANHCAAYGDPQPQSARQQELVCLRSAHANCPRYLRGMLVDPHPGTEAARPILTRAGLVAVAILVASAGVSFGFVLQRGGIDLPIGSAPAATTTAGGPVGSADPAPAPGGTPDATSAPPTPDGASTETPAQTPLPTPPPTAAPTPAPTAAPTATPTSAPATPATPRPSDPAPTATSDRYALLEPCPDTPDCWIYVVRSGDNLVSIANYFGVPFDAILALTPDLGDPTTIQPGDRIRMPPPTR